MKLSIFIASCALFLSACGGGGGQNGPVTVDIYGDSIAFGIGVQVSPVQRLREAGFIVDDHTASGLQLRSVISGYQAPYPGAPSTDYPRGSQPAFADVKRTSQFVVIQVGANDALLPENDFERNLRRAIEIVLSEDRTPVLTGIVRLPVGDIFTQDAVSRLENYNQITINLAKEYCLPHALWYSDYQGEQDLNADRIHRTQEASDRLARLLINTINNSL